MNVEEFDPQATEFLTRFGHRIADRRKELGISQERLAYAAGLSVSSLSQAELGKMPLNLKRVPALASALSWSIADLFSEGI